MNYKEKALILDSKLSIYGRGLVYPHGITVKVDRLTYGMTTTRVFTPYECVFEVSSYLTATTVDRFKDGDWYDIVMDTIDDKIQADFEERFGPAKSIL